jgi:hypothetical protein
MDVLRQNRLSRILSWYGVAAFADSNCLRLYNPKKSSKDRAANYLACCLVHLAVGDAVFARNLAAALALETYCLGS